MLDRIEYVFTTSSPRYSLSFAYEDRPDYLSDCASGVEVDRFNMSDRMASLYDKGSGPLREVLA